MGKRKHQNPRGPVRPKDRKKKTPKPTWACTARCRQVSDSEFETIVNLHDMFNEDIQVLRDCLGALHACPYVQIHIQEWEVPFNPEMPDRVKERMGHQLCIVARGDLHWE